MKGVSHKNSVDGSKLSSKGVMLYQKKWSEIGQNFKTLKGLRQDDPLSSILSNVVDILAILINRAKDEGQVTGIIPHLEYDSLSILQYADDTILFMKHDIEIATCFWAIIRS